MNPPGRTVAAARSFLFVPATKAERFEKAAGSGADVVVLDLEDSVAASDKAAARRAAASWLEHNPAVVRVNAVGTPQHEADVSAVGRLPGLIAVMLPKAEDDADVERVASRSSTGVIALVESALGVHHAYRMAAHPATARLAFGAIDLAVDLGCEESWEALLMARSQLVLASRVARIAAPIDGVHVQLDDPQGLQAAVVRALGLGFGAKLCIHPGQVAKVHEALVPSEREMEWARGALALPDAVSSYEGQMVDAPVLARARALLDRVCPPDSKEST